MEKHQNKEGQLERAMDTNTGGSPGYQSLKTHLVRKWGDIGHQRAMGPRTYNTIQYNTKNVVITSGRKILIY